jgi:terminase large subunit-like protein
MEAAVTERESGLLIPTGAGEVWAPTASGLAAEQVEALTDADAMALAAWHAEVAGDVAARPFWPAAIRRLSLEQRLTLASDPTTSAIWRERERRRVREGVWSRDGEQLVSALEYFVRSYGHVQPEHGPPVPFMLWREQADVLRTMEEALRIIVLKARQLGLTWLALHHAFHMLVFDPATPVAKILALSKKSEDAKKLLQRARRINELLPPYLRVDEDSETKGSLSKFGVVDRGEMVSLTSNPEDARSETASYVIWDEAAFTRNGGAAATLTALRATLGTRGRLCVISTGNGPAEAEGDGQTYAQMWANAVAGSNDMTPVFLPDSVHPGRSEEWRRAERKNYLTEEDFLKEHPETEDDAFAQVGGLRAYSPAGINAAEKLGRELDELLERGELPLPEFIHGGADFGESTHLLLIWPLEGGGIYVAPGEVAPEVAQEVGESARQFCESARALQELATSNGQAPDDGSIAPLLGSMPYDAAGIQSMRTFVKTVQTNPELLALWETVRRAGKDQIRTPKVAFGKYKKDTIDFLRHLFARSHRTMLTRAGDLPEGHEDYCDGTRIIAISPKNKALLRQLRGLERKEGTGEIIKKDDHGPDALVAGTAHQAVRMHDR